MRVTSAFKSCTAAVLVALCIAASSSAAADDRVSGLLEIAHDQFWPPVAHEFEAAMVPAGADGSRFASRGPLPDGSESSLHRLHPDGWYYVSQQVWQKGKDGRSTATLSKQAGWNGNQSYLVQQSLSADGGRPVMAASDEASDGVHAAGSIALGSLFNGFTPSMDDSLTDLLRDVSPGDMTYQKSGDLEELSMPLAGGTVRLRFAKDRLVSFAGEWGEGDTVNGGVLPIEVGLDTLIEDVLLGVSEEVSFDDFRMTDLGVELPLVATMKVSRTSQNRGVTGGELTVRRREPKKLLNAVATDFAPQDIPVGHDVEAFDPNDKTRYVWNGSAAVIDDGSLLEAKIDSAVSAHLAATGSPNAQTGTNKGGWLDFNSTRLLVALAGIVLLLVGAAAVLRRRKEQA